MKNIFKRFFRSERLHTVRVSGKDWTDAKIFINGHHITPVVTARFVIVAGGPATLHLEVLLQDFDVLIKETGISVKLIEQKDEETDKIAEID